MAALVNRHTGLRRPFGLLEKPAFPHGLKLEVFEYKIFVSGKAGVGKTSAVAKLSGNNVPATHCETPGIQMTTVYWPAKVTAVNRVVLFKLVFWDAGETAVGTFDYILPACKDQMDGVLFMFSFIDKLSFSDLPHRTSRVLGTDQDVCRFVLGSKLDLQSDLEVTLRDVCDFESQWQLKVLCLSHIFTSGSSSARADVDDVAPTLNYICDQLWQRDQMLSSMKAV